MSKSFLFRLLGVGKIPEQLKEQLKSETIQLQDEGVRGSITYRNFKAPWKYFGWKRQWYTASIILTTTRLICLRGSKTIINVPLTDQRINRIFFSLEANDVLVISFDAGLFNPDWSGSLEYRFTTNRAKEFYNKLSS